MALTAFCMFLPEVNFSRSLRPAAGLRTGIPVLSTIPVCPLASRWSIVIVETRDHAQLGDDLVVRRQVPQGYAAW